MNTQSTFSTSLLDFSVSSFAMTAKRAFAAASEFFTGWHYWFYFFGKAVKHT